MSSPHGRCIPVPATREITTKLSPRRGRAWTPALAALLSIGLLAFPSAAASRTRRAHAGPSRTRSSLVASSRRRGTLRGIVRVRRRRHGAGALAHGATVTTCSSNPCLSYHGGPVLHSNTGYVIYWQPSGAPSGVAAFPPGYATHIDQYLADVAAADGLFSNVYAVAMQYADGSGNAQSGFTRGTPIPDTDPLPPSGCVDPAMPTNPCLTDAQIEAEIDSVVSANQLPRGAGPIYFLVTPPGLASCASATYGDSCYDNTHGYCAYHSDFDLGHGETIYANMPFADVNGCRTGPSPPDHPNNNSADDLVNVLSHEQIEAMTDPEGATPGTLGAWYHDASSPTDLTAGYEIADLCASDYGASLGSTTWGPYNQSIGSGQYELQTEWSNAENGCRAAEPVAPPTATLAAPAAVHVHEAATFSASSDQPGTFHWDFGDGSGTVGGATQSHGYSAAGVYTVSVRVVNQATGQSSATVTRTENVSGAQPVAAFSVTPAGPTAGQGASFDGRASSDSGGSGIAAWAWDFGDGSTGTGPTIMHAYATTGPATVTLRVTDADGFSASSTQTVNVQAAPAVAPPVVVDKRAVAITLVRIAVFGGRTRRDLIRRGLAVDVRCTGSCAAASRLLLRVSSRRNGRRRARLVEVGRANGQAGPDGALRLRIVLTASGRRLLRGSHHPALTVLVDAGGTELSKVIHPR